jgi:hypothetical protein
MKNTIKTDANLKAVNLWNGKVDFIWLDFISQPRDLGI